jgi:hypothetical protein
MKQFSFLLFMTLLMLGRPAMGDQAAASPNFSDQPLADYQIELLEMAFDVASQIPVHPHIKDRSKFQEGVVVACLNLDQPARASGYIPNILNWRRGAAYADLAAYLIRDGRGADDVESLLEKAENIAAARGLATWRRDRIRMKIAQARVLLGQQAEADRIKAFLNDAEVGKVVATEATRTNEDTFDQTMAAIDAAVAAGHFDLIRYHLVAASKLYDRFYADAERRGQLERKIRKASEKMPAMIRMQFLTTLAAYAIQNEDSDEAMRLIDDGQQMLDEQRWLLEDELPLQARLVELRYEAGQPEKAKQLAEAALAKFDQNKQKVTDIWRAGALRPLAEAYVAMGDKQAALEVYRRAVEEGAVNPNARPRAEDLSATAASMAVSEVQPDEALWARMKDIRKRLDHPW